MSLVTCPSCGKRNSAALVSCNFCKAELAGASSVPFWKSYAGEGEGEQGRAPLVEDGESRPLDKVQLFAADKASAPTQGALLESWERFKYYPKELIIIYFFVVLFGLIAGAFTFSLSSESLAVAVVVGLVVWAFKIGAFLLKIPVEGGGAVFWLRAWRAQDLELGHVTAGFKKLFPLLVANVACGIAIGVGLLFFVLPGIYLAARLQFVSLLIVDKNLSGIDAIKASWELTGWYHVELAKLMAMIFGLNIVASALCFVPVFVIAPVSYGAIALVYERIAEPGNYYLRYDPVETNEEGGIVKSLAG